MPDVGINLFERAGTLPEMEWHDMTHANSLVSFLAKGDDARWFRDDATQTDPVRGLYLDYTSIARVIFNLLEAK